MFRLLLSLFLLAAPTVAANSLRSVGEVAESKPKWKLSEPPRRLIDLNQIQFSIEYSVQGNDDAEEGNLSPEESKAFEGEAYAWLKNAILSTQPAFGAEDYWSIETRPATDPNYFGLSNVVSSQVFFVPRGHIFNIVYTVTFGELEAPPEMPWFNAVVAAADPTVLQAALTGKLEDSISLTTDWALISSAERTRFDFAFVLPYRLTWSFNTTDILAPPIEYDAAVNATEVWINKQWQIFHANNVNQYALQNIDIFTRFTSFQASTQQSSVRYQQSLALYVQLVIGANDITAVPPIAGYLEQLQLQNNLFYFSDALEGFQDTSLPADAVRVLPGSQFTFAVAATYETVTIQESQSRTDLTFDNLPIESYAVVSVALPDSLLG